MLKLNRRDLIGGARPISCGCIGPNAQRAAPAGINHPSPLGELPMGPENAKVTIIEYASASCPHCANFYKTTFPALKKDYIDTGKSRFIFREFPHNQSALA